MTKSELRTRLLAGTPLDIILELTRGQECDIYKARRFSLDDVIYIPDTSLNELQCSQPASKEEIEDIISNCYNGADFCEITGKLDKAKALFIACDWQHPSTLWSEMEMEDSGYNERHLDLTLRRLGRLNYEIDICEIETGDVAQIAFDQTCKEGYDEAMKRLADEITGWFSIMEEEVED